MRAESVWKGSNRDSVLCKERLIGGFKGAGKGIETGVIAALSAPEAAASAGRAMKSGVENAVHQGKETVGAGKEWVVDRAVDIKNRALETKQKFQNRIEEIKTNYQQKVEAFRAKRMEEAELREYQQLSGQRESLQARLARLSELEEKFGGAQGEQVEMQSA